MDWFITRLKHAHPTLDYRDLSSHTSDFKQLLDLQIIKYSKEIEAVPCEWCDDEHEIAPSRNGKGEMVLSCFGNQRVLDPNELKIWTVNSGILAENIDSKNPVFDKKLLGQMIPSILGSNYAVKDSVSEEIIEIRSLGIIICGGQMTKGNKQASLNSTDQKLVYFLYYRALNNADECFTLARLAEATAVKGKQRTEDYISNRIVEVNKKIKNLVISGKSSVPNFIKREPGKRGYHLNPKYLLVGNSHKK